MNPRSSVGTARSVLLAKVLVAVAALPGCIVVSVQRGFDDARAVNVPRSQFAGVREVRSEQEVPSFRVSNAAALARLGPGSTPEDLRREFPHAVFVERRSINGSVVDCFRVDHAERYRFTGGNDVFEVSDEAYFFFRDNGLVRWGMTRAWPE